MAKNNVADLDTTAANNTDFAGTDSTGTTGLVKNGDNILRTIGAMLKKWWNDLGGTATVGGTANAITLTSASTYQSLVSGIRILFKPSADNSGATTLNLDSLGAKAIRKISGGTDVALTGGELKNAQRAELVYDSTANSAAGAWILLNVDQSALYLPLAGGTMTGQLVPSSIKYQQIAVFTPLHNQPPASNYATLSTRNSEPVLQFDTTTQEGAVFGGVMPYNYANGSIRVTIWASLASATTGTLGWVIAFEAMSAQDTDSDGFAADQTATAATVPGTSGQPMTHQVTFTQAQADGVVAGEAFRIRIRRDVANDTAAGDAELIRVLVEMF